MLKYTVETEHAQVNLWKNNCVESSCWKGTCSSKITETEYAQVRLQKLNMLK